VCREKRGKVEEGRIGGGEGRKVEVKLRLSGGEGKRSGERRGSVEEKRG